MVNQRLEGDRQEIYDEVVSKRDAALRTFVDHITAVEFGSAKYLAFSDAIARESVGTTIERLLRSESKLGTKLERALIKEAAIKETIRTRTDTIPEYFAEMELIDNHFQLVIDTEFKMLRKENNWNDARSVSDLLDAAENVTNKMIRFRENIPRGTNNSTNSRKPE